MKEPQDPEFEARIRANFAEQRVMRLIGARLASVAAGEVVIELPFRDDLTQQNGYVHAGIVTTILDSACGYAAFTLMPADSGVLSVEFKVNLLAPAKGDLIRAVGSVKRAGKTLTVCTADAIAIDGDNETVCATMLATMFRTDLSRS
ncbi:MAG TPA: PaaI family thioesterase [Pyrinomonadaceae bacterium]|nr:PaaI family thioesterase [Pyrinomonadaceae bacterium]